LHHKKSTETLSVKRTIFWVAMVCSSERVQCFRGMYSLHLQGRVVSQERDQQSKRASQSRFVISKRSWALQVLILLAIIRLKHINPAKVILLFVLSTSAIMLVGFKLYLNLKTLCVKL
jgi:hypothetical protein